MPMEIIDLTNLSDSPPSLPIISSSNAPMNLNYGLFSSNPNLHQYIHHNQHQTNMWVPTAPRPAYQTPIQINTNWPQPDMQSQVTTVLKPLAGPNTFQFSNGVKLRVPWTQLEHDLFLMGLIEYGKGKWSKIAKHYVCNKTPQQVQSYGISFFKHLPHVYVHGFRRKKNMISNNIYSISTRNRRNNDDSDEVKTPLPLFPTYYRGEVSSCNNMIKNNFEEFLKMVTDGDGASTLTMPPRDGGGGGNGEVDVELRLSLYK